MTPALSPACRPRDRRAAIPLLPRTRFKQEPLLGPGTIMAILIVCSLSPGLGCGERTDRPLEQRAPDTTTSFATLPTIPMCRCTFDATGGDPGVPPELGGPGFTGEGWSTVAEIPALGDPHAPKGGTITHYMRDWPTTFRQIGFGSNDGFSGTASRLCYEPLLAVHPITQEFVPRLASHWQIADDGMTFRCRINPAARWSDGSEVTAEDVVATIALLTDSTLADPAGLMTFAKMSGPRAVSKYIVEIKASEPTWSSFLYFVTTSILPAHEIGGMDGTTYRERYQFKMTAVTGPYELRPGDVETGVALALTRRRDYWGWDQCFASGCWNFDRIKFIVVKDEALAFEKVKKGEIDIFGIPKAQWWAEEVDGIDGVRRGLIQKRKIFADSPMPVAGLAINTRRPPLDDLRLRLALCCLLNRKIMLEKLYFNEYEMLCSYFQGGIYQCPENRPVAYDPVRAVSLLSDAGWVERAADGILVKDGRRLEIGVQYDSKLRERFLTIFQEDCRRVGVQLHLEMVNPSTHWKNILDRRFDLIIAGWGGLLFPDPAGLFQSDQADENGTSNITGFKDRRVDELCHQYEREFDLAKRIAIIHEIDRIVFAQHHYVLTWCPPAERLVFWNRFGQPDWYHSIDSWWVDPEKDRQVEAGRKDRTLTMASGPVEVYYGEASRRRVLAAGKL